MNPDRLTLRPVLPPDNPGLAAVIREVLTEFGAPTVGTAFADPSLEMMYETYQAPRSAYWVVADGREIWGGGGIAPLEGDHPGVCELQKMYFRAGIRGLGWGDRLISLALKRATDLGFHQCYLETMPYMEAAQKLYRKHGFTYLEGPLGQTGHTACTVWMQKNLGPKA